MESVSISSISYMDRCAIGGSIGERTGDLFEKNVTLDINLRLFRSLNAICRLVFVAIATIWRWLSHPLFHDPDQFLLVDWGGKSHRDESEQNDCLKTFHFEISFDRREIRDI